jgi:hypothetical protein
VLEVVIGIEGEEVANLAAFDVHDTQHLTLAHA